MAVIALKDGYKGEMKDRVENFHGKQLLFVGWDKHLMFCAPHCVPVPPSITFRDLFDQVISPMYAMHPDWKNVKLESIEWLRSSTPFVPDLDTSLEQNGLGHKALIRLRTPGLGGIGGSAS
jgi:phenol hydroxylase P4 protein